MNLPNLPPMCSDLPPSVAVETGRLPRRAVRSLHIGLWTVLLTCLTGCDHTSRIMSTMPGAPTAEMMVSTASSPDPFHQNPPPLFAVWQKSPGHIAGQPAGPFLRAVIWENGDVVFAKEPEIWTHNLLQGQISGTSIANLKKQVIHSGIMAQKEDCYLTPDGPQICMLLSFDGKRQLIYWDEVKNPRYGINDSTQPRHITFIRRWHQVNDLILSVLPARAAPFTGTFPAPPPAWYPKPPVQSP